MTIDSIRKSVEDKLKELNKLQEKAQLPNCDGTLIVKKVNGETRYFQNARGKQKYLNKKEEELIANLQLKGYYKSLSKAIKSECKDLFRVQTILDDIDDADNVYLKLPEEKRNLIEPLENGVYEEIKERFLKHKEKNRYQYSNYRTINGENVRSKSELIIADRLKNAGVVYEYEPPTLMDGVLEIWHPDFMVLNARTGKTYYWEHFGMLDSKDYCDSFQYKLERYAEIGIFPGKNLIITTESSSHPISTQYIDKLIEEYLK